MDITYSKKRADTELRVGFYSVLSQDNSGGCSQWYFQFDGKNCSRPGQIVTSAYADIANHAKNLRRSPAVVSGVCKGTSTVNFQPGNIKITVNLGACPDAPGGSPHTGQTFGVDSSYIIVEEYCPQQTTWDTTSSAHLAHTAAMHMQAVNQSHARSLICSVEKIGNCSLNDFSTSLIVDKFMLVQCVNMPRTSICFHWLFGKNQVHLVSSVSAQQKVVKSDRLFSSEDVGTAAHSVCFKFKQFFDRNEDQGELSPTTSPEMGFFCTMCALHDFWLLWKFLRPMCDSSLSRYRVLISFKWLRSCLILSKKSDFSLAPFP